jgi:DoxX-like protein
MNTVATAAGTDSKPSKSALWAGWIITILVVLFLAFDGITKVLKDPHVLSAMADLVFPVSTIAAIGAVILVCTLLDAIPRTSVLGAILLTAHLGGAVAVQVRVAHPLFEASFPIIFGVLIWLGIYLREPRLRALVPIRTQQ